MSFNVLVVPEDPTHNGYILKPLVEYILQKCGRPNARITVLTNPRAKGYDHAKSLLESELFDRYSHMDLILFLPDADGKDKSPALQALEARATDAGLRLICECDAHVKESVFQPFLAQHGDTRTAGGGRESLMQETLKNYSGLLARCPEIKALQDRICAAVAAWDSSGHFQ